MEHETSRMSLSTLPQPHGAAQTPGGGQQQEAPSLQEGSGGSSRASPLPLGAARSCRKEA